jgi:DNA-binding FadR family transcriptional regulator
MLGVAVVEELVDAIVTGRIQPGNSLPPESQLSEQFGVSRTVIRESVKRVEEKGMVTIARGRGTEVRPSSSWNMLDRVVLTSLIKHDDSLGVLDQLSIVRAQLESVMAADTARSRSEEQLGKLERAIQRMRDTVQDEKAFRAADVVFHEAVMEISGNQLAESIARILFERARDSARYHGVEPADHFAITLSEHEDVFEAIVTRDSLRARDAMNSHILASWRRRRLPDARKGT